LGLATKVLQERHSADIPLSALDAVTLLQWRFGKFPAIGFQVLDNRFGNLKAAFLNHSLSEAGDLHFFEGDSDIEDELLIKCQSGHDGPSDRIAKGFEPVTYFV
jgi:hypothetical protein